MEISFSSVWEAFKTATDLDGLVMVMVNGKRATHYQHMFGSNLQWTKHLRLFGEVGTVKLVMGSTMMVMCIACGIWLWNESMLHMISYG